MKILVLTLLAFALSACGHPDDSEFESQSPFWCPGDFYYNNSSRLCENKKEAFGPFTPKMVEICKNHGGGNACESNRWERTFARYVRGRTECPPGTQKQKGYCTDGWDAYGPFLRTSVKTCLNKQGGEACRTLRWDLNFAISIGNNQVHPEPIFPFAGPALADYATGGRRFGACRGNNCWRKHAGVDLVHYEGHPIYAVDDGKVVDFHYFYANTYALVIKHSNFVVRYGEVDRYTRVKVGQWVKKGDYIAKVGDLAGTSSSMLHFEMYSGDGRGPLTTNRRPYYRRWDLMNPTNLLKSWPYMK